MSPSWQTTAQIAHKFWGWMLPAAIALLAPISAVCLATCAITFIDMVFGVWASMKRGEPLTSHKMRRTIVKIFVYESAIVLGWVVGHYIGADLLPLARMVAIAIGMVEFKSCLENLNVISGSDVLRAAIDKINGGAASPKPQFVEVQPPAVVVIKQPPPG